MFACYLNLTERTKDESLLLSLCKSLLIFKEMRYRLDKGYFPVSIK